MKGDVMQEESDKPAVNLHWVYTFGVFFWAMGTWIGVEFAEHGFLPAVTQASPALAGGILLIVTGRILRAVTDHSSATAEVLQIMRRLKQESSME